jgi:hypothetical protein
MQHLFTVEVLLEHPKTKDHLQISIGEVLFVLLLAHDKLPDGKYLVEKEDGTSEMQCMSGPGVLLVAKRLFLKTVAFAFSCRV